MGEMELFFKCNKENRENREMPVCSTLKDENGNVVMWQIRHITTEENEDIRQECMEEKGGKYRLNVNKYLSKITAMSVVYPNLYDADLQDSYGKKTPESLLKAIVDCPGEYDSLVCEHLESCSDTRWVNMNSVTDQFHKTFAVSGCSDHAWCSVTEWRHSII